MPHQQAALQAAMINPAALSAIIQSQNPQLLHQIQHQQLQQLQQLHQQNLRLAAAFNQNQMGMFIAWLSSGHSLCQYIFAFLTLLYV